MAAGRAACLEFAGSRAKLFVPPTEEPAEEATVPNLPEQAALFEWAGVSLGRENMYLLYLSLKQLAAAKSAPMRFWGKLVTRDGDYYVAETKTAENPAEELEARLQMEGTEGPNKYTYFVSKSPSDAASWKELPHVTPDQIVVARQIRRLLSGNLDAPVPSFPPFPGGLEANLVRAIIACVTADTVLALTGTLAAEEGAEDGEFTSINPADEEEVAGMAAPSIEELRDLATWVHAELDLSAAGRAQKVPLPLGEDGEPIQPEDGEELPEPLPPLRPIAEDTVGEAAKPLWVLRTCPGGAGQSAGSVVYARSLKWPGAVAVASGKDVANVYVGFGLSAGATENKPYAPPLPKPILSEWAPPEDEEGKELVEASDVCVEPPKEEEEEG